ncbi:hypothetical protein D3P08_15915 [Paenibacillus nanensis]|uniref:Uncharacterized protein n=1 Tax=Paenibacillus nanensis TaxID=393251 RepID=A0A3A1UT28_9BACL|nr:hypothetical protein [Paenibacillus nanensis]RIX51405.1 hypothetical protein D3P08_15915 [Paenibacillus nanensis]
MPNYVPYIGLIIPSIILLIWLLIKTKQFHTFVIFSSFAGMIYVFEVIIVVVLGAYEYMPQVTPIKYLDSMIGASVSNTFTVPSIAALIAVFQLRFRWIAFFSLLLGGIEILFLHWGIYKHEWWRVSYSIAGFVFYFSLTKWWFRQFYEGSRPIQAVTFFLYTMSLIYTFVLVLMLSGIRLFKPGIFHDVYRDDTFFTTMYGLLKTTLITAAIFWLRDWRWLFAAAAVIVTSHYLLIRLHILNIFIPMWIYILIYSLCCSVVIWLCYLARRSVQRRLASYL